MIDHSEVNRALAKAIAYKQCGKDCDAAIWAEKLVRLLECAEILNDNKRPLDPVESERAA
jgi:hypothetical protein